MASSEKERTVETATTVIPKNVWICSYVRQSKSGGANIGFPKPKRFFSELSAYGYLQYFAQMNAMTIVAASTNSREYTPKPNKATHEVTIPSPSSRNETDFELLRNISTQQYIGKKSLQFSAIRFSEEGS